MPESLFVIQEQSWTEPRGSEIWNRKLGHAWAAVLHGQGIDRAGTVLEIGPGFAAKVGFGLAELGFHGTLLVAEPNSSACRWIIDRYRRLLPQAEVVAIPGSIPEATSPAGRSLDLLVANHVLDDLLLNAAASPREGSRLFAGMRPGAECSRDFIRAWRRLLLKPERLDSLVDRVTEDLARYVAAVRPSRVALNQYPSWRHRRQGLGAIETAGLRMLHLLATKIGGELFETAPTSAEPFLWLAGPPRVREHRAAP